MKRDKHLSHGLVPACVNLWAEPKQTRRLIQGLIVCFILMVSSPQVFLYSTPNPALIPGYYTLQATFKDAQTLQLLVGVQVDVYKKTSAKEPELDFTTSTFSGKLRIKLDRNTPYLLIINKVGYQSRQLELTGKEVSATSTGFGRTFLLTPFSAIPEEIISSSQMNTEMTSPPEARGSVTGRTVNDFEPITENISEQYFKVEGTVKSSLDESTLPGIRLEVYRDFPDGTSELTYIGSAFSGRFSLSLTRDANYRFIIDKQGFQSLEWDLKSSQMQANYAGIRRDFFLLTPWMKKEFQEQAAALKPEEEIIQTEEKLIAKLKEELAIEKKRISLKRIEERSTYSDKSIPAKEVSYVPAFSLGTYQVFGNTSLRKGPHHTERVQRRMRTGERVEVLERTSRFWWKIRFEEFVGYIKIAKLVPID